MLLTVPAGLTQAYLGRRAQALLDHHDALRLRLDAEAAAAGLDGGLRVRRRGGCGAGLLAAGRIDDLDPADRRRADPAEAAAAERLSIRRPA